MSAARTGTQTHRWLSYEELAWTETVISSPDDYAEQTEYFVTVIKEHIAGDAGTLLHLGCGAGGNDGTFKKHFMVTGVDISQGMLAIARKINPEVTYLLGDMRSLDLNERFDAVAIPESIDYMVTLPELAGAIDTACRHLLPGGVLLIAAKVREEFRENNFCYTGAREGVEITIFENNYIPRANPATYEATIVYLIRQGGILSVHTDCHTLGLFSRRQWRALFKRAGLHMKQVRLDGAYDRFLLGQGEYPMQLFVGIKPA